ncbi:MAG TPA: 2TM domain-containing protein [Fimbriimonadaceae bacterium]|nr:2TM domain-containing protein [Fimbriimonadaceae bacterium]HRJ32459.1 2TM domain-containing protein [Fimbriimonadaceae bacterium]
MPQQFDDPLDTEILSRALKIEAENQANLSHLLEQTAAELGISKDALIQAREQVLEERSIEADFREFRDERMHEFKKSVAQYVLWNSLMVFINVLDKGTITWAVWPLSIWGIFLLIGTISDQTFSKRRGPEFQKWRKRKHARQKEAEIVSS